MKYFTFIYALPLLLIFTDITPHPTPYHVRSSSHSISGTIQFPSMATIPHIPLYCTGTKILTESDTLKNNLSYTIPKNSYQTKFSLIITPLIEYEMLNPEDDSNTIAHLKVPKDQPYTFYRLKMVADKDAPHGMKWNIKEKTVPVSRQIPDNSIIMCCNPDFIETLEESPYFDLPIIKVRNDLISFVGSEKKIHDQCDTILLATMDIDTIHSKARHKHCIKVTHNTILVAPPIT